ncbi:MAG: hypothetical protein HRU38_25450 [Saccharospirillaceae bacterium]|nr:hypothetical protein [Pseudomonadales bacterium]NRB81963.1 hypothetical protein [Saccharospirillaceae bacterium]
MKKVLGLLICPLLYGCEPTEKQIEEELGRFIWTQSSESITISQDNRFELNGELIEVSFTRDELPPNGSDLLIAIRTTNKDLTCYSDGGVYLTTITNQSGEVKVYFPTISDCGDENREFISSVAVAELFEIIK